MKKYKDYLGEGDSALSDEDKERAMKRAMAHADGPERGEDRKKVSVAKAPWEESVNEAGGYYTKGVWDMIEKHGADKVMRDMLEFLDADQIEAFVSAQDSMEESSVYAEGVHSGPKAEAGMKIMKMLDDEVMIGTITDVSPEGITAKFEDGTTDTYEEGYYDWAYDADLNPNKEVPFVTYDSAESDDDISELKKLSGIEEAVDADEDTVRELVLYADNDEQLYTQSTAPIQKNLSKKFTKGTYDHELAAKLWKYHADRAAKKYGKEHGNDDGFAMFSPADRRAAAQEFADNWLAELEAGNVHESAKPDFLDIDKDGDKEESMKKAAKDAESVDEAVAELRRLSGL